MIRFLEFFEKRSVVSVVAVALVMIAVISLLDYWTGDEISFSIFYLLPISLVAWLYGRRAGLAISAFAAAAWLAADVLSGRDFSDPAIPFWNMLVRFGFFVIVTLVLSALRIAQVRQEEWAQFIVHDLRSPLANTIVGLQTLKQVQDEAKQPSEWKLIQTCLSSCQRMVVLINSLLDQARLEKGQMPLALESLAVIDLIQASCNEVAIWSKQEDIALHMECRDPSLYVEADREITTRILINLLSNAIKFSPPGSVVTVAVAAEGGYVEFQVIDQGQGIPGEWKTRIFEKFAQAEARRSSGTFGSGLGLSYCRDAVMAQGGRIWIETTGEHGTTIVFTLPRYIA